MELSKQKKYRDNLIKFIVDEEKNINYKERLQIWNEINLMSNLIQMQDSNLYVTKNNAVSLAREGTIKPSKLNT